MRIAVQDLKLGSLNVVHAGSESFPLAEDVHAVSLPRLLGSLKPLNR
jgi:hypothetical protein